MFSSRESLVAGRSAGPFGGVATFAGLRGALEKCEPFCVFSAGIHLRPVGAPVRCAASLRLLARERISRYGYSCFLHRVFRERWVAGRSAGPLSGVASFAGPPAVLWFFQAPGARDRTHGSGGSADLAGKWRSRESMGPRLRLPAECARLWRLLRRLPRLRPFRMPRTPGTRKIETKTHTNNEHARE